MWIILEFQIVPNFKYVVILPVITSFYLSQIYQIYTI